jgi:hypothetical protein
MYRLLPAFVLVVSSLPLPAGAAPPPRSAQQCRTVEDRAASPAWDAIGRQYSRLGRAIERKDFEAMLALYAPSFAVDMKGEAAGAPVWSREKSLAVQKQRLDSVSHTRLISNTITRLKDCGDRATATVIQQWYRTQNVDGVPRNVETVAVQDEEWIRTGDGWKRGNIGNIHQGAVLVDDKRIDASKPYKPDAPAYDPYPEPSSPAH